MSQRRNVIIWSGGVDSTAILYIAGMFSTKTNPVITISVKEHFRCSKSLYQAQTAARKRYLRFAKKLGHFIEPYEISVGGNAIGNLDLREYHCWASMLPLYFKPGDIVSWGYKKHEEPEGFHKHLQIFNKFVAIECYCDLEDDDTPIEHIYPLRDIDDVQLINMMKQFNIPVDCIHCCAEVKNRKVCGNCCKCDIMYEIYGEVFKPTTSSKRLGEK